MSIDHNQVYRLSFTWNKPQTVVNSQFETCHTMMKQVLTSKLPGIKFIFQLEKGLDSQLLHMQGHMKLKVKHRPKEVAQKLREDMPGIHVSPDSNIGSTNAEFYCTKKDETYVAGPWADESYIVPDYSDLDEPYGWQVAIKDILLGEPEKRTIYWVWEETGCTGKSQFTTYMEVYHKIVGLGLGKASDNFYAVSQLPPAPGYIFDVPMQSRRQ